MVSASLCSTARRACIALVAVLALVAGDDARAFQGPYATLVEGVGGFDMDVDVRWPDDPPPAGGWPVVFFGHGAGGDKTTSAGNAGRYANDGYVALTWTNRSTASNPAPETIAGDLIALKDWLVNDFQAEAGVTAPVDPARFGITGSSLGGYTSWCGGLLANSFATIVPFNWGFHFFTEGLTLNGSIDRITGGPRAALFPTPYDDVSLQAGFDATFGPATAAFGDVDIPVMMHVAMLDARTGGTYALHDYEALTAAPGRFLYMGTGGHGTPETDGPFRSDLRDRWFAHYLKGESNGIDAQLPIQLALLGTNEHLGYASWPPPDQQTTTLWLRAPGALAPFAPTSADAPSAIVSDPGSYGWDDATPNFPPTAIRNNLPRQVIAWETEPLTEEVLLIGEPTVRLEVSGTGSRYQVNVHLYDQEDGEDPLLLATSSAVPSTSPAIVETPLSLTARRVPAGHRLRLEVTNRDDQDLDYTNGYAPQTETLRHIPFFELSTTAVHQDVVRPSSLTLPLIGRSSLPLPGLACDAAPRAGCRLPSVPGASPLVLKDLTPDARDSLSWKWLKGSTVAFGDLGDPRDSDAYAFCLYDGTASSDALRFEARAPAGELCGTKPCWQTVGSAMAPKGFRYLDPALSPDGVKKLQVLAGTAPRSKVVLSGKGESLGSSGVPTLPLPLPLVAQLQTTDGCWEVTYTSASSNGPTLFKAK